MQLARLKNPARNDRRGDLVLMKGTNAKKASSDLPLKGLDRCNLLIFFNLMHFLGPY